MWRELIAELTRLQAPLSVAVFAPDDRVLQVWDLARDHFGSATAMVQVDRPLQALRALADGSATVAVLPLPNDDESWWVALMSDHDLRLRVFARLPFVSSHAEEARAFALGQLEIEPSGDDLALLAIEAEPGLSRGRLRELLMGIDLHPAWAAAWRPDPPAPALHLVEVEAFVTEGDERLAELQNTARGEILRVVPVGGYARPLSLS
jgi:hypothetical protein